MKQKYKSYSEWLEARHSSDRSLNPERPIIFMALAAVAILTGIDLVEDYIEGVSWSHVTVEGSIILVTTVGALILLKKMLEQFYSERQAFKAEVSVAREDAKRWQAEASSLLEGLGKAIEDQFGVWHLTPSEKEVGLLLLKGLSHKEIAVVRSTSEKTVRQQAASIYAKSHLDGRAQLSAFFLEDLLLPNANGVSCKQ